MSIRTMGTGSCTRSSHLSEFHSHSLDSFCATLIVAAIGPGTFRAEPLGRYFNTDGIKVDDLQIMADSLRTVHAVMRKPAYILDGYDFLRVREGMF